MAQAVKRRASRSSQQRAGGNIGSLLITIVLMLAGGYYGLMALTTGDLLWFSSSFNAQPRQFVVVDHAQRTEIHPTDPRFQVLTEAFNKSISAGYHDPASGFSDPTWRIVEENSLYVDAIYAEPVRLRGNFVPTTKLRIVLSGDLLHSEEVLFRSGEQEWDRSPLALFDAAPLRTALSEQGLGGTQ